MNFSKYLIFFILISFSLASFSINPRINIHYDTTNSCRSFYFADLFYQNKNYDSAILYYKKSLNCIKNDNNLHGLFDLNYSLSKVYLENHMFDSSLMYALLSLNILKDTEYQKKITKIRLFEKLYYFIGHLYGIINEYDVALKHYNTGVKYLDTLKVLDSSFNKKFNLSFYYTDIGHIYAEQGHYNQAIEYYNKSIKLHKELNLNNEIYNAYNYLSIAELLLSNGDFHQALVYYNHLINIYKNHTGVTSNEIGIIYNNIGLVYFNLGEYLKALNYFNKAKQTIEKIPNSSEEVLANIYNNLGDVYRKLNKNILARFYFDKVHAIYFSLYNSRSLEIAFICNNYANLYKDMGENDTAFYYYLKALSIRKERLGIKHDKVAQIYQNIGILYYNEKLYDSALLFFQKALCANVYDFEDLSIKSNPSVSSNIISKLELIETLFYKAEALMASLKHNIYGEDSLFDIVIETYDLALAISDYLRNDYLNNESRFILNTITLKILNRSFNFLNQKGYKYSEKLFEYLERCKNFELYFSLSIQKAKNIAGIPKETIDEEKRYKSLINFYQTKLFQINNTDSISKSKLEKLLFDITTDYELFISNLEQAYPSLKPLKFDHNIPSIEDIKKNLNDQQVLISYYYQDSTLYSFVISKDTVSINILYSQIFTNNFIQEFLNCINIIRIDEFYGYSYTLYQSLIEPIHELINDKNELLIIPYGLLYYIPFETLVCRPIKISNSSNFHYLINDYIIKYHYSSALWYNGNNDSDSEDENYTYEIDFVGFAPVFINQNMDEYLESLSFNQIDNTVREYYNTITPLPYSGEEVNKIFLLFKSKNKIARQFLLENATEQKFKSNISKARYIHIASHGFVNKLEPSLSGIIFYDYLFNGLLGDTNIDMLNIDENDGILYLNEIFDLNIDAKLAVISTCESGIGKLYDSEGVMSMARGLLYAGVENIIISLFKVPDKITKCLMLSFYSNVLSGYSFAESLRNAKIELINNGLIFPKIWSSFILIGL